MKKRRQTSESSQNWMEEETVTDKVKLTIVLAVSADPLPNYSKGS